jgi:hypothetical protein
MIFFFFFFFILQTKLILKLIIIYFLFLEFTLLLIGMSLGAEFSWIYIF